MKKLISLFKTLAIDEDGATLIEYSLLISLIAAATVAIILLAGAWIVRTWQYLGAVLGGGAGVLPGGF